jgi:hypothetical protein
MIPSTGTATPNKPAQPFRKRRRNPRAINSCLECRERKSKCSKSYPCESCVAFGRECVFIRDPDVARLREHAGQGTEDENGPVNSSRESIDLSSHSIGLPSSGQRVGGSVDPSGAEYHVPGDGEVEEKEETPPRDFEWEVYQNVRQPEHPSNWEHLTQNASPMASEDNAPDDVGDDDATRDVVLKFGKLIVTQRIEGLSLGHYAKEVSCRRRGCCFI